MRAVRIHGYGGPEVMRLDDVPTPQPAAGQVLVKVRAASVNPIDWKMRRGLLAGIFPLTFPRTLGRDCAGEVDGKLVAGVADPRGDGTHAEYALLPEAGIAPVPVGMDAAEAASLCVAGLSAWISLVEVAKVQKGMRVLVHGGAGGVGSLAIQIARELGAAVVVTSTQVDYCRKLGAERVIDHRTESFTDAGPYDAVLDTLGGEAHVRSLNALKPGGVLVGLSATPVPAHTIPAGVRMERPAIQATRERLAQIFDWVIKGRLRPQLTRRFHLEEANQAYAAVEAPHGRGKIVLDIS
ncbi:MAG TPA: NADP-dependent oxidoreductase [Burkholderiales bacterium]|nr:NADP-dependent oxidoreductase [Burkholderiales bacterium]